jgi:plasmid stabilization system protein ParE
LAGLQIIVGRQALRDLELIVSRIALDSPQVARKIKTEMEDRFLDAAKVGSRLRKRSEFGEEIRVVRHKPWMIFFRVKIDSVIILRVLHGAMHPKRLKTGTHDEN